MGRLPHRGHYQHFNPQNPRTIHYINMTMTTAQKHLLLFGIGLIFFSVPVVAQIDLTWINPAPNEFTLFDVAFPSPSTGYAVGAGGTIYKTTDAGVTWTHMFCGTLANLYGVDFSDDAVGVIVGDSGIVLRTDDGGRHWSRRESGTSNLLWSIDFASPLIGYAVGEYSTVLRTTDGGQSWTRQIVPLGIYFSVSFLDQNTGVAVGSSGASIYTTDGGTTWRESETEFNDNINDVCMVDKDFGLAVGDYGAVLKTTDGGKTWAEQPQFTLSRLNALAFSDAQNAVIVGNQNFMFKTPDGGQSWIAQTIEPPSSISGELHGVAAADHHAFHAVGHDPVSRSRRGEILMTDAERDNIWHPLVDTLRQDLSDIAFFDDLNGVAVGERGSVLATHDGGMSWAYQVTPVSGDYVSLSGVSAVKPNKAVIVGNNGTIMISADAGRTWEDKSMPAGSGGNYFTDVAMMDDMTGFIIGQKGVVFKTSNGGETWETQDVGTDADLNSIQFIDPSVGVIVGDFVILRTEDGGQTWTEQVFLPEDVLFDVSFADRQHGAVVGRGSIYYTNNGGKTWFVQQAAQPAYSGLFGVHLTDASSGIAVGLHGTIQYTVDGGHTWHTHPQVTGASLRAVLFTDHAQGVLIGTDGTIMQIKKTGPAWSSVQPDAHSHRQTDNALATHLTCQPNLVTDGMTITFDMSSRNTVALDLVDIQGKSVLAVLHEEKVPGHYTMDVSTRALPPGTYYCRLDIGSGDTIDIKKIIVY